MILLTIFLISIFTYLIILWAIQLNGAINDAISYLRTDNMIKFRRGKPKSLYTAKPTDWSNIL